MQNFGKIKESINHQLAKSIKTKNTETKDKFKLYVKMLKENDILKTQFLVYNNIEKKIGDNDFKINEFVKANITLMEGYTKQNIKFANNKLAKGISLEETNINETITKLHEDITTLIFTEKTPNTIDTIIEATDGIVNYIKNNKDNAINENTNKDIPISLLTGLLIEKFNTKYEGLDETSFKLVKGILEGDEIGIKNLFNETHGTCLTLVNTQLTEGNVNDKEKLLAVKEKLLTMEYISENDVADISKLITLKETLS